MNEWTFAQAAENYRQDIRNQVIEECARVAETVKPRPFPGVLNQVAAAIRALKDKLP